MNALKILKVPGQASSTEYRHFLTRWRPAVRGERREAPAFLIRLVGKSCAKQLARDEVLEPHHD
jgi:hypothetical protein